MNSLDEGRRFFSYQKLTNILNIFATLNGNILGDIWTCGTRGKLKARFTVGDALKISEIYASEFDLDIEEL